ncbi:MAG TPA: crossover junction endodeoxyribonuclease RuvC, partial [Ornithinibacter sp.]|nr:crossover junction endodeoxyribonuclease RuvC [Ornithinibacter sp.]
MRVLGVDPGLTRCGLGVVDGRAGRATMVAVGVVRTPSDGHPGQRLVYLERELDGWLARFEPEVVAVERVFADVNVASVMTTAHATAVALLTATKRGIPVVFHTP